MKNINFSDVPLCNLLENYRRFGGMHCQNLQDREYAKQAVKAYCLCSAYSSILQIETVNSSETSLKTSATWRHIPEDKLLNMTTSDMGGATRSSTYIAVMEDEPN
jgi:hypothetical protein